MTDELVIGMRAGTSLGGVDAVLVNLDDGSMDILHAHRTPYPAAIRTTLAQLSETGAPPDQKVSMLLDENLAVFFARAAQNLVRETGLEMRDIRAIGSGGQNVWRQPRGEKPVIVQLGRGDLIARNTATTVVNNFHIADIKAGGQGAPLAPLLHRSLFHNGSEDRAVLNLGGIARLTILPASGGVSAYDCGPGNCLMDAWARRHLQRDCDDGGRWAAKGKPDEALLDRMLADPYFSLPPPKSTCLEYFNIAWLDRQLGEMPVSAVDVQSTLAELSARGVAQNLEGAGAPDRLLVCGGGAHNDFLLSRIAAALPGVPAESTGLHGIDPDWIEAVLFAWLAQERLNGHRLDTRKITGAKEPVLPGEIHEPG